MKNKTRKCLLIIVLAIVMIAVFMPGTALAEEEVTVTNYTDFTAAIENSEVTTINVTADFALAADVTIDRQITITCLSDPGNAITTDDSSIIITGSEAVVTFSGNLTVTGQEPIQVTEFGTANISGGTIAATGDDSIGVYVGDHSTVTVSGGSIEATGDGSAGVYVFSDGTADISNSMIDASGAYSAGVWVEVGTATVSGGTIVAAGGDSAGVLVRPEGTVGISGGIITASGVNSAGVYVVSGTADISGDSEISGDGSGVYVFLDGTANISGGTIVAEGEYGSGIYVEAGTANISGGTITATGADSDGIYVCNGGTVIVSGVSEISGDATGVYAGGGSTANISGGTIEAARGSGSGVYVNDSTADISGGTITATGADSDGIFVYDGGTVIVSGAPEIRGDLTGVNVHDRGTLTVSGDPEISGDTYGVWVNYSTADISGGTITATGTNSYGIFVEYGGAVTVSDEAGISGDAYGIYVYDGTVTISVSANLIISGGIYDGEDKVFLTDLPDPVAVTAGETETVELIGVDETISFEVDNRDTDSELAASIDNSDKDRVNLAPPDTTPADTYTLALYATTSELNNFNLIIPVAVEAETIAPVLSAPGASDVTHTAANLNFTSGEAGTYYYLVYSAADAAPDKAAVKAQGTAVVKGTGAALAATNTVIVSGLAPSTAYKAYVVVEDAAGNISDVATINITTTAAPDTVIDITAISGVPAPVSGSTPVTAIAATDQYTGTVSWAPAVVDDKYAPSTVYTATITLTPKAGYTLTGVAANFFTVAGATSNTNAANSGVITAVFPATAAPPDSGDGDNSGGGGRSDRPNPPPPVTNASNKTVISTDAINKTSETTSDGKTVESFTVQNTAASQIQQAKEEGSSSVEFNIASSQTSVTDITIPSTVLKSASGMNISVSTPHATLELPAALVNALAAAGQSLNLSVTRGEDMANPEGGTVLGTTTEITTDIAGETQVTIPLAGVSIPADPAERAAFLNSLAIFTYHSDGETELITGEIIYDASGNPVSISFPVDKFSTFAIVKLSQRTIALNIGSSEASLNGLNVALDAPAFINTQSNRTLVPLRFIGEALGAKVEWLPVARQVSVTDGEQEILLTIDSQLVLKNGQSTRIDCAPLIVPPGRTFLPLRFVSEALGAEVVYDEVTKRIIITREYGK